MHDRSKGHLWRTLWSNIPGLRVEVVGNKVKWRISKRVFQKNKARQILEKRTLLTPWYKRSACFSENLACLVFFLRFVLLPYYRWSVVWHIEYCIRNTDGVVTENIYELSKSVLCQYNTRLQITTNAGQKSLYLLILLLIRWSTVNPSSCKIVGKVVFEINGRDIEFCHRVISEGHTVVTFSHRKDYLETLNLKKDYQTYTWQI